MNKGESINEHSWPRNKVKSIETRKRDLVIRIADWTHDKEEPAYDVELYIAGVYDWNESQTFTTKSFPRTKQEARRIAIEFAQRQIEKHLRERK